VVEEARLERSDSWLVPRTDGWFVLNVRDTPFYTSGHLGSIAEFESGAAAFEQFGIRVTTLLPGQPHGFYHREDAQEAFLVLAGECLLLVEGEERALQAWDFVHCPPGTEHVLVGAGGGPCAILMVGARRAGAELVYPVSGLALRHGAGVETEAKDPRDAYAEASEERVERPPYWAELPWAEAGAAD
jgi:uncharacterized cupin superfamily protein